MFPRLVNLDKSTASPARHRGERHRHKVDDSHPTTARTYTLSCGHSKQFPKFCKQIFAYCPRKTQFVSPSMLCSAAPFHCARRRAAHVTARSAPCATAKTAGKSSVFCMPSCGACDRRARCACGASRAVAHATRRSAMPKKFRKKFSCAPFFRARVARDGLLQTLRCVNTHHRGAIITRGARALRACT